MTESVSALTSSTVDPANLSSSTAQSNSGNALLENQDFTTFLNLLTTQLQFQDPMDPMKTEQFVTQLTQFSQLEQTVRGNDTLEGIRSDLSGRGVQSDLAMIGRSVLAPSDQIVLSDGDAFVRFEGVPAGEQVQVTISDQDGAPLSVFSVTAQDGETVAEWSGSTSGGDQAPDGIYTVELQRLDGEGEPQETVQAMTFATVEEVRLSDAGADIVLENGLRIPSTDVRAVR